MSDIVKAAEEDVKKFAHEIESFFEKLLGFVPDDQSATQAVTAMKVQAHALAGTETVLNADADVKPETPTEAAGTPDAAAGAQTDTATDAGAASSTEEAPAPAPSPAPAEGEAASGN